MQDFDAPLSRTVRIGLIIAGAVLLAAAWPVGFVLAVFAGGGHQSPFGHSFPDALLGGSLLSVPVLMVLVGLACIAATSARRARLARMLTLLFPIDMLIIVGAIWYVSRPPPPVPYPLVNEQAVIPGAVAATGPPPRPQVVECAPATRTCVAETASDTRPTSPAPP